MGTKPERRRRTPSFFKVLIGDFSVQLRIPIAFVNRFNGELPHKVIIWSPTKRQSWRIIVEKVDNRLAFTDGWTVFVQENSLKLADFLLFRYVGNSKFSVRMYGKDGCEKKLDPPVSRKEKAKQDARTGKDRSVKETRKNSLLSCDERGRDGNSVPVEANDIGMSNSPRKFRENELSLQNATRETEPKCVITRRRGRRSKVLTEFQVNKALKQASEFTSNFPFFVTVMQSSYLKSGDVYMPYAFAKRYFDTTTKIINLHNMEGKLWNVTFYFRRTYASLTHGWEVFMNDNCLELGDVCVFELINKCENLLRVVIFRGDLYKTKHTFSSRQEAHQSEHNGVRRQATYEERLRVELKARALKSDRPFFFITTQPSYVEDKFLNIPSSFAKSYLNEKCNAICLKGVDGRTWSGKYDIGTFNAEIHCRWREFARDNHLDIGDVCVFKLIDGIKNMMEISIFRVIENK